MDCRGLHYAIKRKKRELNRLVDQKQSLQDQEIYRKSCELDLLVVAYMRMQCKKTPNEEIPKAAAL